MLRKNTLDHGLREILKPELRHVIHDFLSNRKCVVEANDERSEPFNVELGCVQGSVLGPKLFNLYTRNIPSCLTPNAKITTYADDSYVVISAPEGHTDDLKHEAEECLKQHIDYLKSLGMVVMSRENRTHAHLEIEKCRENFLVNKRK
jgi:hypothetical protein